MEITQYKNRVRRVNQSSSVKELSLSILEMTKIEFLDAPIRINLAYNSHYHRRRHKRTWRETQCSKLRISCHPGGSNSHLRESFSAE
ncbi:hypothetical protein L873DRAFT_1241999 [Choiromyces venosus 120613-1]|uniref:Uncharacterized protein n=1 Tax=Choiromyces venosus 120613-1 TaxID=1336337 RepID=A0A3N4JD95_9PEZI|nr:hypothetical protein L873DRAFT_1241999 [Choiromyces venosus 120613-1]